MPPEELLHKAAEDRSDGSTDADAREDEPEGSSPLAWRQDLRHGDPSESWYRRVPHRLNHTPEDQSRQARREGADQTPHREHQESDILPYRGTPTANTSMWEVTTHPTWASEAPKSSPITGTTTFTIVPATTETNTAVTTTARKSRSDDGMLSS
jgi:hypothetical protein